LFFLAAQFTTYAMLLEPLFLPINDMTKVPTKQAAKNQRKAVLA
jgi:hypothetical protein